LVALKKFQCLVAFEKVSMFGGPWKVSMQGSKSWWPLKGFNVWWPMEGKGKTSFSPFITFVPNKFYLNLFFSIDIKVLLYHGSRSLLYTFLSFSLTYKL
jgi:hypothetical protein